MGLQSVSRVKIYTTQQRPFGYIIYAYLHKVIVQWHFSYYIF